MYINIQSQLWSNASFNYNIKFIFLNKMMNQFDFELLKSFLKKNPRMCLFINIDVFSSGNI